MEVGKVFIASDHAGFEAKEFSKECIKKLGFEVVDLGTNSKDMSVDYPDFANIMAESLNTKEPDFGILVCGTGLGISMAANRHKNIRCALCHDVSTARLSREHNDANVLCFGARVVGAAVIEDMINAFFSTEFAGGRHQKRVDKLGFCSC
ncbi:ribose 5-phosphate isomerase B [Campylobacter hyointestinalis subsp. hyointestinalis]|uniref:Ribose 5-phosphate isomerase B n=1 Tax=Campylobacter hyointestinalis subsp. hyointestinalis TaxID=91352 RepID=A0A0S4RK05_CAMHY|nr:ribose 5-phosphate isomerase B [Campylobacter hyointestinalis]CUU74202.1 ribose 5-phosphate isomerase B [Campylobacter hyointestinalis subsp. hyointestinalis]